MTEHVMLIFPHPDDETFSAAGTVQHYKRTKDAYVSAVSLTLGEMGRNFGMPPIANRETLPHIRKKELEDALSIMGVDQFIHLGYRDKTLEFELTSTVANHLLNVIEEHQPTTIITFYPGLSIHPDHDATGEAVVEAIKMMDHSKRPTLLTKAITADAEQHIGEPDVVFDISPYLEMKKEAIRAHRSQALEVDAITKQKLKEGATDPEAWIRYETFWTYKQSEEV
ncbi:bacillithiol biosynthesis deacetylase BshB2 [Geomicrobium sp. JCM 19038]|uniref:bacillithiol biosynthesis deacetylase BshB2 n=1 Tax=Geomicrobium sp. JCM 19038 TaxID=1460635 RepID=UPI00045F4CCB|nr:bacillithiol biosynthesis deacetylase BshB2 [Geomicrobium sp. JCM 19038]GAK09238.1 LmbE family protein [Geomicrobium sp. JCM 19038]